MQLGFNLPNSGPTSAVASFTRIAQEGEAMGYDYLKLDFTFARNLLSW